MTFVLLKNGSPVARIVPNESKTCTGRELAEALRKVKLSTENAKAWYKDLQKGRKILKAPEDKWR